MLRRLGVPLLLAALTLGVYWRLAFTRQFTWLEHPQAAAEVLSQLDVQARLLHATQLPLWNPFSNGGEPLLGKWDAGTVNPLHWILFVQSLRDGHLRVGALQAWWLLLHWLAALLCYGWCRSLRVSEPAALFGSVTYALAGYFGAMWHPAWLSGALWLPAVLWAGERKRPWLAGAAMGMAWLSTDPSAASVVTIAGIGTAGIRALPVAVAVGALQWLNASTVPAVSSGWREVSLACFPGLAWVLLAVLGVAKRPKFLWLVLLGPAGAQLALCGAAAIGIDAGIPPRVSRWVRLGLVAAAATALVVYSVVDVLRLGWDDRPLMVLLYGCLLAGVLLALERGVLKPQMAGIVLLAVALSESAVFLGPAMPETGRDDSHLAQFRAHRDLARYLHEQPGWFRVAADPKDVPYRFGDWFGVEQATTGVRYWLAKQPPKPDLQSMFESDSGVKIWRDRAAAPTLSTRHDEPCPTASEFEIESRNSREFVLSVQMPCPGMLVTADRPDPNWRVWVDHHRATTQGVDGHRAVRLEAGKHRLEFRYRPARLWWSAGLFLAGVAAVALETVRKRPKTS